MEIIRYDVIIQDMTFSYSRLNTFDFCRYKWLLQYILGVPKSSDCFFSSYGVFIHDILAKFYKGEGNNEALSLYYLENYFNQVVGKPQKNSTAINYFRAGLDMVSNLAPTTEKILDVEQEVHWTLGGREYIGYVDIVARDDSGIAILDHKNRDLKPRSVRKKPTKTDEELDAYLRQLYLYSIPIQAQYGAYPASLQFNCFRKGVRIKEAFDKDVFDATCEWAINKANEIECNDDWSPSMDFFGCNYLCDVRNECEYYQANKR